jgi:hypothetical protein
VSTCPICDGLGRTIFGSTGLVGFCGDCGGTGRAYATPPQAVKVATGGAPPLTPEGISGGSHDGAHAYGAGRIGPDAMVDALCLALPKDCNRCIEDVTRDEWKVAIAAALTCAPPQADAKAIPSPAPQAPPPEGLSALLIAAADALDPSCSDMRLMALAARLRDAATALPTTAPEGVVIVDRATAARAADHLDAEADCLRDSHTIRGTWSETPDDAEHEAKADHDSMRACAAALRAKP